MAEVLSVPRQPDAQSYFSRRSSPSPPPQLLGGSPPAYSPARKQSPYISRHQEYTPRISTSISSSAPASPALSRSNHSFSIPSSASSTTLSLNASFDHDEEIAFPTYDDVWSAKPNEDLEAPPSPRTDNSFTVSPTSDDSSDRASIPETPGHPPTPQDDTAIAVEPSQQVDYLSHVWEEEDIWASWRHIVSKRKLYGQSSRLENASWRTWAKSKNNLKTVSPEALNWLKDCDVTWLYGPLQSGPKQFNKSPSLGNHNYISKSNSFVDKKPILKKRSMSEVMLQRSISASSLVKQAAAAVQAQQSNNAQNRQARERPRLGRTASDFVTSATGSNVSSRDDTNAWLGALTSQTSSGFRSPESTEQRHIRFDDKVEQCIAVDCPGDHYDDEDRWSQRDHGDDSSDSEDEGGFVLPRRKRNAKSPKQASSRNSFAADSKTIAKLPATKLKYRADTPEIAEQPRAQQHSFWGNNNNNSKISPSPSSETLRPSHPSQNFLLPDEDDEADMSWEPSGAFANRRDSIAVAKEQTPQLTRQAPQDEVREQDRSPTGMRRTESGMFMPDEEDEDDRVAEGLFGKVVDTVNTARDIAHVIWNVGWRR